MQKLRIHCLLIGLLLLPASLLAQGIIGECADCHTMHNSEQGQPVAKQGFAGTVSNTPNQNLLKFDCIACHAQNTTDSTVNMPGGSVIPQVYHTDTVDLAAGNFKYIADVGNRKGHNVQDLLLPAETDNINIKAKVGINPSWLCRKHRLGRCHSLTAAT